jgi:hypothetical protein
MLSDGFRILCGMETTEEFNMLISSMSHAATSQVRQQTLSCSRPGGPKDLVDGKLPDAQEVGQFFEDELTRHLGAPSLCL